MSQHFLLTAAARSLSLGQVLRLSDEEVQAKFVEIRWSDNGGQPYSPHCGCACVYGFRCRPIRRCKACGRQFSVTSGTIFHSRKLPPRDYLAAITIFVNAVKGISALQLGRDLHVQYKTAFVLAQQLDQHWADLTHIDGTLRVLGAEPQSQALRPRHAYRRTRYFGRNEVSRLVLNILRIASGEPIGIEEISRRVVIAKGFDPKDASLRAAIRQHVRPAITRLHKQGVIESVSGGRGSKWKVAAT